jgi:glycogen debranching enzyme
MSQETISVSEDFYVVSTSAHLDDRLRVLKEGDTFAVFNRFGDIEPSGNGGELGIYYRDTRYLSRFSLTMARNRPLLLSSSIREDNGLLAVDLMNTDLLRGDQVAIPRGTVHIFRSGVIWRDTFYQRIRVHNYGSHSVALKFLLQFATDFADIFEVRGMPRERRGRDLPPEVTRDSVLLGYCGLDDRLRHTRLVFDPSPNEVTENSAEYAAHLAVGESAQYYCAVSCELDRPAENPSRKMPRRKTLSYEEAANAATDALREARAEEPEVYTSNEQMNDWLNRSIADLHMMRTQTSHGLYPYAGVPWFSTPFGRDGIITALECLWFNPALARGVLTYLAATQAEEKNDEQDAEPGKILHETRSGEMAALGEVPFGRYYGSIDATPLFIMLAGAYYERTGDLDFAHSIWPNVERALQWIEQFGDLDGDGFVEYARRSHHGLVQQGWKDSVDSVFHADGELAEAPIALCEVQGYLYAAKNAAAGLARVLGAKEQAARLTSEAENLRQHFEESFWCEDLSTYALALDGKKRPCRVRTSNAGHCLFTGIASSDHARRVAATLTNEESFSGWGIRTVASSEARYNPMSYHNGSVWPHDNAIIAAGFARYGLENEAAKILAGLLDASLFFDFHRLPELFCGFARRTGEPPTFYPVACSPQAWAAAAVLLILQSSLGLSARACEKRLVLFTPVMPGFLQKITIHRLRVGHASVDLSLTAAAGSAGVNVLHKEGELEVVVSK